MGKLTVTEYVTLDGVIEAPGGGESFEHGGWSLRIDRGDEFNTLNFEESLDTAALLFGQTTYEGMAAVWPHMEMRFEPTSEGTKVSVSQTSTSRTQRDGGREGSEILLRSCADFLSRRVQP